MRPLALLLPLALALALAPPGALAQPPLCGAECRIDQNSLAYVTPVAVVPDGARVTFASFDTSHVTSAGTGVGGGFGCFYVASYPGEDAPPVQLDVAEGALHATTLDGTGRAPVECVDAVELPGGAFALPYHCALHPSMRGVLVVAP